MGDNVEINPQLILSYKFPEETHAYTERDVAIYALGVGVCGHDAVDPDELKYVYDRNGQQHIKVLPTFAAIFSLHVYSDPVGLICPGLKYDHQFLLHGQHYTELYKPLPSSACLRHEVSISGLHDKGKAAIIETETRSFDQACGELLCMNRMTCFIRGAGGFSKSSKPYSYSSYPPNQVSVVRIPVVQPFATFKDHTQPSQALLYRLSGDYNPLHSDPAVANVAGFSQPILHGLCTLGHAVRAIIRCICKGDEKMVKSISARFLLHVYPGETLLTEMWLQDSRVIYQTKVEERNCAVLSGYVDLHRLTSSL